MIRIRTAARAGAGAALLGAALLSLAAPAGASAIAGSVTIDNTASLTVKTSQTLTIAATAAPTCRTGVLRLVTLVLSGPTDASASPTILTSSSASCNQSATLTASMPTPALNGVYTVTMQNGAASNSAAATLEVLIPPARARGLAVTTSGTTASFTWAANPESDIIGYEVFSGSSVATSVSASDACRGSSSCSATHNLGAAVAGHRETFTVRAVRCGVTCGSGDVTGPASTSVAASFSATTGPSPSPTTASSSTPTPKPTASTAGGKGPGTDGGSSSSSGSSGLSSGKGGGKSSGSGGVTGDAHKPFHLPGYSSKVSTLTAPSLPTLGTKNKPLALGKSGASTVLAPQIATSKAPKKVTAARTFTHDIRSAVSLPPLWRGIAAAAVLLLLAVHLRAWASRTDLA